MDQIVFMDFEASALRDGFPVEVGWAWIEGNNIRVESLLISPAEEWLTPGFTWDPVAEGIHGLPLARLQAEGEPPVYICRTLNDQLRDKIIVFDTGSDGVDRYWLDLLFTEGGAARNFKLAGAAGDFLTAAAHRYGVNEANLAAIQEAAPRPCHRAAEDAVHYAWRMLAIQTIGQKGLGLAKPPFLVPQIWHLTKHIEILGETHFD